MGTDASVRGRRYLRLLTASDRALLAAVAAHTAMPGPQDPGGAAAVEDLLADPNLFATILDPAQDASPGLTSASPFLVFATAIHRARAELDPASVVVEWTGPRERLPVFAGAELRAFLDDGDHRLFLAELLASYVHLSHAAVTWTRGTTVHHRRVDELDLTGMAGLLAVVDDSTRPAVYRRLGDASLFLTGVFPDHTASTRFAPLQVERLARSLALTSTTTPMDLAEALDRHGAVGLLERLGQQWYRLAAESAESGRPSSGLDSICDHFPHARRALNHLADRWLFPLRSTWLPAPG